MSPQPEIEGSAIVVVGSFNPAVFQPAWFARNGLFSDAMRELAEEKLQVVHPEFTAFNAGWLEFNVSRERCVVATNETARISDQLDLVIGAFTLLPFTPVRAFGINRNVHYRLENEERWHHLGDLLGPKKPWEGVLTEPGLLTLTMHESRENPLGYRRVEFAPSQKIQPGIFISVNDHYQLVQGDGSVDATGLVTALKDCWEVSASEAVEIAEKLVELP